MRLIDADALIELLKAWQDEAQKLGATVNIVFSAAVMAQVNAMPTIEPDDSCDGCIYDNADDGVLVPCGFCKRNHPDNYTEEEE